MKSREGVYMHTVVLKGEATLHDYVDVVYRGKVISLSPSLVERVKHLRDRIEAFTAEGRVMYGINTGFGALKDTVILPDHLKDLQHNIVRSHAVGVGDPVPEVVSRGMLFLLINSFSKGYSGVRPALLQRLVDMLNAHIHPVVPRWGSVGASGDLAPLSHLALAVIGEGDVFYKGKRMNAAEAFEKAGMPPTFQLDAKEGLALLNGTHFMLSMLIDAYLKTKNIWSCYLSTFAVFAEVMETVSTPFDPRIHKVRRDKYALEVAQIIREKLKGSKLIDRHPEMVQDSYSIRCFPQIASPIARAIELTENLIDEEINAVTDNPLVFEEEVLSGGNFHGAPIAWVSESLKTAIADMGNVSIAHMEWLLNPRYNKERGLTPFLTKEPGLESGFMIVQYMAASRMAHIRVLSHPASVDNYYTSALQEDVISLGAVSVDNLHVVLQDLAYIVAGESLMIYKAIFIKDIYDMLSSHGKEWVDTHKPLIGDKILGGDSYVAPILEGLALKYLGEEVM